MRVCVLRYKHRDNPAFPLSHREQREAGPLTYRSSSADGERGDGKMERKGRRGEYGGDVRTGEECKETKS